MRALFQILIGMATASTVASDDQREHRRPVSGVDENRRSAKRLPDRLAQQFEHDRRQHQDDLPVELEAAEQLPGGAVELGDEERREVPDLFLGADLAQAAAGESAADSEGQRALLAGERGRQADA